MMKSLVGVLLFVSVAYAQIDCSDKPDGSYGWGCRSYTRCEGGNGTVYECPPDKVFNDETGGCDDPTNVDPPCGLRRNCTGVEDGRYSDKTLNCTAFYTCLNGLYFGHNPCNPGLVFDEDEGICTWPYLVRPPCGTCSTPEDVPCSFSQDLKPWTKAWKLVRALKEGKDY